MRENTHLKAKKCSKFAAWPHVRINYSHESESVSFSLQVLQLFYSPWLCQSLKAEFNFELILKAHRYPIVLFSPRLKDGKTRKICGLRWPWSSIQRPPKHRFYVFPFYVVPKKLFSVAGLKVCRFSQQRKMFTWRSTLIGHDYHELSMCWTDSTEEIG